MGVFSDIDFEIRERAAKEAANILQVVQNSLIKQHTNAEECAAIAKGGKLYAVANRMTGRAQAYKDAAKMVAHAIEAIDDAINDGDI